MNKSRTFAIVPSAVRPGSRLRIRRGGARHASAEATSVANRAWEDTRLPSGELDCVADVLTREQIYRRYLAGADGLAALVSAIAAAAITGTHLTWLVVAAPAVLVIGAKLQGLYDRDDLVIRKSTWSELPRLLSLTAVTTLIGYAARAQLLGGQNSRAGFFLALWFSLLASMLAGRTLARRVARARAPDERCVIVGDAAYCSGLGEGIAHIDGVTLVCTVPLAQLAGSADALHALTQRVSAHRLIIAFDRQLSEVATLELVRLAKAIGLRVSLLPSVMAAVGGSVVVDQLGGYTLLGVPRFGLSKSSAAIKRAADVFGALVVLLLLAPVMVVTALLIKFDTPGPVFFQQTRVGRRGTRFGMLKFRSMVDGAEALKVGLSGRNEAGDGMFKIAADPRITTVGRALRRTKIDELPQLFNVLAGKMSLVGPRPLVLEEDEQIIGLDRRRLHLTPGMTGPWQILGSSEVPITEMAKLDYLYIANWSLWEDLRILGQTLFLVAHRDGI
jgi:exopolysaccharide biosynthesis polyprenyl glycosylphosphotransferase